MVPPDDPHAVLGVAPGASTEEIRAAYKKKARANHPDARPDDPEAAEKFRRIREAYQKLREGSRKPRAPSNAKTDPGRAKPRDPSTPGAQDEKGGGFKDVFDRVFHKKREEARYGPGSPFHRPRAESSSGRSGAMVIPFRAAIKGGEHVLDVEFADATGTRRLRVTLPPGIENEQPFKVEGKLVKAIVAAHPHLRREGKHVLLDLPLTLPELAFGARVQVPTVDGMVEVIVPPGSKPGQRLRLRGKGVPEDGDQFCVLALAMPDGANREVLSALRALDRADDRSPRPWDPAGSHTKPD